MIAILTDLTPLMQGGGTLSVTAFQPSAITPLGNCSPSPQLNRRAQFCDIGRSRNSKRDIRNPKSSNPKQNSRQKLNSRRKAGPVRSVAFENRVTTAVSVILPFEF